MKLNPLTTVCLLSMTVTTTQVSADFADTIFTNGTIYTEQNAEAVAVIDGKIAYLGSDAGVEEFIGSNTEVIDLEGAMLMPGFIDNHNHVFEAASEAGGSCMLDASEDPEGQISYLRQCAADARPGEWVIGYGFSIDAILEAEGSRTPLQVIDSVFPDQPVIIMEQTSHSMWVNSAALRAAGITSKTPDPQGGVHLKDPVSGELNGILLDNAGDILMQQAWNSLNNVFRRSYEGLLDGLYEASAHGITTIGDGRMYWKRGWYEVWQAAQDKGELSARVSLRPWIYPEAPLDAQLDYLAKIQSNDTDNLLIVDQVKMYSDGIIINGTAKLAAPYNYTYLPKRPYGINYIEPDAMQDWLLELNEIGYGAHIHAIGDGAVNESLNAIETARREGSDQQYSLTHVEMIQDSDIPRFETLNVTADFQVAGDYAKPDAHGWATPYIGKHRLHSLIQLRPVYDSGANVTLSSDWNVNDINPLVGIANSLQMGKAGMPDIDAAIDAYTINAAYTLGLEEITGSIEEGKSADFVMLSEDITKLSPDQIANTEILLTMLQGEIVFDAEEQ